MLSDVTSQGNLNVCHVPGSLCNCKEITLTTTNTESLRNQQESFGSYYLYGSSGGYPVYQHQLGQLYLYHQGELDILHWGTYKIS